ncbi:BlaI/MecI/CopY family transcriptional regulator [Nonomuraea sp. NPDC049684]|uniref:BlaI/MecI/CopY family transcriptional regulator n=1 Tax=Nonomuraea sp. NPDC049684 TaxID=3364356 RepID=UPI0037BE0770
MKLGNLERSVMEALWRHPHGLFAHDLAAGLPSEPAVTTVLTVLMRLANKGMVARERVGRAHLYKATADKDAFVAEAMRAALAEAGDVVTAGFAGPADGDDILGGTPGKRCPVYEIVAALAPPVVVGGAFIVGVVHLVRAEARAKAAEGRAARERAAAPPEPGGQPEPRADG